MNGSRSLLIGLALSVGLNLLLIGAFAGTALRPSQPPTPENRTSGTPGSPERAMARALIASASEGDRRAIQRDLRRSWQDTASLRRAVESARTEVGNALQTDPYDEARTVAAFAALSKAEAELKTALQTSLAQKLNNVSPEMRKRVVESFSRRNQRRQRIREERRNRPN